MRCVYIYIYIHTYTHMQYYIYIYIHTYTHIGLINFCREKISLDPAATDRQARAQSYLFMFILLSIISMSSIIIT